MIDTFVSILLVRCDEQCELSRDSPLRSMRCSIA